MQHHRRRSCPNPIEMESPHVCGALDEFLLALITRQRS